MKIPLGNGYALLSDPLNFWIVKERTAQESGKKYDQVVSGYYNNLNDLIEHYIDRRVGSFDAESIKDLSKQINKLKREVKGWKKLITLDNLNRMEQKIRAEFKP